MKKLMLTMATLLLLTQNAFAMEVPTETTIQNLNGSQQYIKVFTVAPGTDPATLIEEPFEFEDFTYTYASIVKQENRMEAERGHTEAVTVKTASKDLSEILSVLAPTIAYKDGAYAGTLNLDHTSLHTEAAGYATKSYAVSETKRLDSLSSNDMSYVPATTVKNGMTLPLANVEWQVQATALVDDVLVPSQYAAVATYSSRASYQAATGYITTAEYTGNISCDEVDSITYTLTYLGSEHPPASLGAAILESVPTIGIVGGIVAALAAIITLTVLLMRSRRELAHLRGTLDSLPEDITYEEAQE